MRLVATDLDGTLLRPDGSLSERSANALAACSAAGASVVLVTGRPMRWLGPLRAATVAAAPSGICLCSNGAVRYDLDREVLLAAHYLSAEVVLTAVERLRRRHPTGRFGIETLSGFRHEPGYVRYAGHETSVVGSLPELLTDDPGVVKLLWRCPATDSDGLLALAREELAGLATPVHSDPRGSLVEISPLGVDKGSALAELAGDLGIAAAEVVAFGDMPNDVPMLRWAGRSYAVADAHPEALAVADAVAPPAADDGVAKVLEELLAVRP